MLSLDIWGLGFPNFDTNHDIGFDVGMYLDTNIDVNER